MLNFDLTNLAANCIRGRRGVDRKIRHQINFADRDYRPFNAFAWPDTPSGLLSARHAHAPAPFETSVKGKAGTYRQLDPG